MVCWHLSAADRNRALLALSPKGQKAFFLVLYKARITKHPDRCRLVPPHVTASSDSRYKNEADPHQVRLAAAQQTAAVSATLCDGVGKYLVDLTTCTTLGFTYSRAADDERGGLNPGLKPGEAAPLHLMQHRRLLLA